MACALVFANSQGVGCKGAEGSGDGSAGTETGGDGDGDGDPDQRLPDDELEWPALDCDPIAPAYCAFPFPSNVYPVADDQSATGRRGNLSETTLPAKTSASIMTVHCTPSSESYSAVHTFTTPRTATR